MMLCSLDEMGKSIAGRLPVVLRCPASTFENRIHIDIELKIADANELGIGQGVAGVMVVSSSVSLTDFVQARSRICLR